MLKVKAGDLDKLGLLFERYNRKLFSYFFRFTHRRDISEDLVQAVFERILKYRHTYEGDGAFSTWIYRIAHNLQADHYRNRKHKIENDAFIDPETLTAFDEGNEKEEAFEENRQLKLLKTALEQLDGDKKETLFLSRYQGLRYREIAEIMDCSVSVVKVRVFRAINELKERISELQKEEP